MFEQIVNGLQPYLAVGFLDDITSSSLTDNGIVVQAGQDTVLVNITESAVEVLHGENHGTVLSGITASQAIRFILQALGTKDFIVPVMIQSRFQHVAYPGSFKDATVAPIGITAGRKPGAFNAVYRDARGSYYIHEDECRISLKLFKELYDRNSEAELLSLPKLFSSEQPPVLLRDFVMVSEQCAEEALASKGLVSRRDCAKHGIPLRLQSAVIPQSGSLRIGNGYEYEASELGKYLMDLSTAWSVARKGVADAVPAQATFSSLKADLGSQSQSTGRVEVILEFQAPWPGEALPVEGIFVKTHKIVMPRVEAAAFFQKLDRASCSSDAKVIEQAMLLVKDNEPVVSEKLQPLGSVMVQKVVSSQISKPTAQSFLVSSTTPEGTKELPLEDFIKEHEIPEWLSGCSVFSVLGVAQ